MVSLEVQELQTEIAQSKNYAGLILETPFTSMVAAAKNFYPYLPVSILLKDRYENEKKNKEYKYSNYGFTWKKRYNCSIFNGAKNF